MVDTTIDELRRCPICQELGEHTDTKPADGGSKLYLFTCKNPNCRWFNGAPWLRQRRRDGSWVEAQQHKKFFKTDANEDEITQRVQSRIDADIRKSMGQ